MLFWFPVLQNLADHTKWLVILSSLFGRDLCHISPGEEYYTRGSCVWDRFVCMMSITRHLSTLLSRATGPTLKHVKSHVKRITANTTMLFQSWPSVAGAGPTLKQHCSNTSCVIFYNKNIDKNPSSNVQIEDFPFKVRCMSYSVDIIPMIMHRPFFKRRSSFILWWIRQNFLPASKKLKNIIKRYST